MSTAFFLRASPSALSVSGAVVGPGEARVAFAASRGIEIDEHRFAHAVVERLDPAIVDRPSRFDRKYHFGLPAGAETYGVRFPDSLFDDNYLPTFTINGTLSAATTNAQYSTAAAAALLGIDLASPTTAPWPSAIDALAESVDSDHDGNPGVTAFAAQGSTYSNIPTDITKSARASAVYVVIRQVTQVNGTVVDCNHMSGSVTIPQLTDSNGDSKYAIDSHVIGCELEGDGGTCDALQWSFIDGTQPVFSPTGTSTFASVRMPANATCLQVRTMLP